jgi:hypothetical protein
MEERVQAMLEAQGPFGPVFFATQLAGFVRECCPATEERLPSVTLHLFGGDTLEICHVVGLAPTWVAVAVKEGGHAPKMRMRTELVPYIAILRVALRSVAREDARIGFEQVDGPRMLGGLEMSPEEALRLAGTAQLPGPADDSQASPDPAPSPPPNVPVATTANPPHLSTPDGPAAP